MGLLELCNEKTPTVASSITVHDAAVLMTERHVGSVAVVEGPKIVGVFTERDLMRRVVAVGKDPTRTKLGDVMSAPVRTVGDATTVAQATAIMREHHIRHLAILDERGDYRGMVALRYLLYTLMDELEDKVGDLYGYLMADAPGGD
jgi:CBS domain-containing protein